MRGVAFNIQILVFVLLFSSCGNNTPTSTSNSQSDYFDKLQGKKISTLDSLPYIPEGKKIIYLFGFYDCENCVDAGFTTIKFIDELHNEKVVESVACLVDPKNHQQRNEYFEYVHFDDTDKIRRELKFVPTPLILVTTSENEIVKAFIPKDTIDTRKYATEIYNIYMSL